MQCYREAPCTFLVVFMALGGATVKEVQCVGRVPVHCTEAKLMNVQFR
jgi:hypothetical protein